MAMTAEQKAQAARERKWRLEEDVRALKRAAEIGADTTRRNAAQKALQNEITATQKALAGVKPKPAAPKRAAPKRKPKTK